MSHADDMTDAEDAVLSPYDRVLYPQAVFPQTHPNRLATVAFLRGIDPAPIHNCRVLELGCGVGSNLTSMAFHLRQSEFIGIDLAQRPIAAGQAFISKLELRNIQLHTKDICEVGVEQFGRFDFIIAHGVYSWVPGNVRERMLEICREMLNPQGVAYISYNAYPGNHLRDMVRRMMLFHTAAMDDPVEKVGQARGLLKFIAESTPKTDYYLATIRSQFERATKYADEAFYHDDLSPINQSFYFHEFYSDAIAGGLQYVGEANANDLLPGRFTDAVMNKMKDLEAAPEFVREQYKDFIRGTAFRQSLLCHQEIRLAPDLLPDRVRMLYISCDAAQQMPSGDQPPPTTRFVRPGGAELETTSDLVIAALKILYSKWPGEVAFPALLEEAAHALQLPCGNVESETLAGALLRAYRTGFVHMYVAPHALSRSPGERPAASKLARYQLQEGQSATNQVHVAIKFPDTVSRQLLILLDGTRDRNAILNDLTEFVEQGHGKIVEEDVEITDKEQRAVILRKRIHDGLISLGHEGMLVG